MRSPCSECRAIPERLQEATRLTHPLLSLAACQSQALPGCRVAFSAGKAVDEPLLGGPGSLQETGGAAGGVGAGAGGAEGGGGGDTKSMQWMLREVLPKIRGTCFAVFFIFCVCLACFPGMATR
jgi:hypothetical protein